MVVGFSMIMLAFNSAASTFSSPLWALVIGPVAAVGVLAVYALAGRYIERRTVIDLTGPLPEVLRRGQGDLAAVGLD